MAGRILKTLTVQAAICFTILRLIKFTIITKVNIFAHLTLLASFGEKEILNQESLIVKAFDFSLTVPNSKVEPGAVIDFSDAMIFAMVFPNVIGLFFLAPVVRDELKKFLDKIKTVKK